MVKTFVWKGSVRRERMMENDLFWNSYTGVADIVLHASRGERSLVEKRQVSGNTTAIGFSWFDITFWSAKDNSIIAPNLSIVKKVILFIAAEFWGKRNITVFYFPWIRTWFS